MNVDKFSNKIKCAFILGVLLILTSIFFTFFIFSTALADDNQQSENPIYGDAKIKIICEGYEIWDWMNEENHSSGDIIEWSSGYAYDGFIMYLNNNWNNGFGLIPCAFNESKQYMGYFGDEDSFVVLDLPSDKYITGYKLNGNKLSSDLFPLCLDSYDVYTLEILISDEAPPNSDTISSVTFNGNGGAWADGSFEKNVDQRYYRNWVMPENPVKPGCVFAGWYFQDIEKISSGDVFDKLASSGELSVSAYWIEGCDITYHPNGGQGSSFVQTVEKGQPCTLDEGDSFTWEERVLTGWNTEPDGSGTMYNVGEKNVIFNEDTNLYAYWADVATCSFTFKLYGQRGSITEYVYSSGYGYEWNTDEEYEIDPKGNNYAIQMSYNLFSSNEYSFVLYSLRGIKSNILSVFSEAIVVGETDYFISKIVVNGQLLTWDNPIVLLNKNSTDNVIEVYDNGTTPVPSKDVPISATFNANGGSWPSINADVTTMNQNYLTHYKFPEEGLVKTGLHVRAWLDETPETPTEVNKESVFEYMDPGHLFSALWAGYVTFDANGGEGAIDPFEFNEGAEVAMYDGAAFKWDKHILKGWNTEFDGSGTHYDFEDTFEMTGDITLYAEWEEVFDPPTPPVPPTPGGDVENVDANAQTGDAIPFAVIAIVAFAACGIFATRKFVIK